MGFKNSRGVTIDEDTWQKLEQLQKMTGLSKAQILRNLLKRALSNYGNSWTSNAKDLKKPND